MNLRALLPVQASLLVCFFPFRSDKFSVLFSPRSLLLVVRESLLEVGSENCTMWHFVFALFLNMLPVWCTVLNRTPVIKMRKQIIYKSFNLSYSVSSRCFTMLNRNEEFQTEFTFLYSNLGISEKSEINQAFNFQPLKHFFFVHLLWK